MEIRRICTVGGTNNSIEKVLKLIFNYRDNFSHPNNMNYMI
ncbi:hypothetical protein [Fusobacterium ulcerans]|nr:hypothetical protein [Fusobacterium ulcerans]